MPNYKLAAARAARKYGLNEKIFLNMIKAESNFIPGQTSSANAQGIAQFIPSTAKAYGVNLNDGKVSDDLDGAARYLRDNLKRTKGNYTQALSIYNSGRPDGYLSISETRNYVNKIMNGSNISVTGDVGKTPGAPGKATPDRKVTTTKTTPADTSAQDSALLDGLLSGRKDLLQVAAAVPTTPASSKTTTKTIPGKPAQDGKGTTPSVPSDGKKGPGKLLELFWQGPNGINAKNGAGVPQGFVSGHDRHVHVAADNEANVLKLAGIAKSKFGLNVGEHPKFGGVAPVHVTDSNHYARRAIDVTGPPKQLAAYAHYVARIYGVK